MRPICRLCLSSSSNTFQKATTIDRECFTTVLPEISLHTTESSMICGKCLVSLHAAYSFRIKCLETEGIVKDYYKGNVPNLSNTALKKVLLWRKQKAFETCDTVVQQENGDTELNNTNNVASEIDRVQCLDIEELNVREEAIKRHSEKYRSVFDCFLQCDICNKRFHAKNELLAHVGSHFSVKCKYCDKYFKDNIDLKKHGRESHQFKIENCYSCDICCQWYIDKNKLLRHILSHFEKPGCKVCNETFGSTLILKEHLLSKHDITIDFSNRSDKNLLELDNIYFEVDHTELMKNILRHLEKYREVENHNTKFICEVCNKNFNTENSLNSHLKLHFCRPKCFRCNKSFYNSHSLKRHISDEHSTIIKADTACDENQDENRTETSNIMEYTSMETSNITDGDGFENSNTTHIEDFELSMANSTTHNDSFTSSSGLKIETENYEITPIECLRNPTNFDSSSNSVRTVKEEAESIQNLNTNLRVEIECESDDIIPAEPLGYPVIKEEIDTTDVRIPNPNTTMSTDITDNQRLGDIAFHTFKQPKEEKQKTKSNKLECEICKKKCKSVGSMTSHLKTHTDVRKYRCSVCKNMFLSRKALREHKEQFPNDESYKCTMCGKTFHSVHQRNYHRRIHTF